MSEQQRRDGEPTTSTEQDIGDLAHGDRLEYDRAISQQKNEDMPQPSTPAPYDVATPDMEDDRVITKGERERAGPTEPPATNDPAPTGAADNDGLLQTSQVDRRDTPLTAAQRGPDESATGNYHSEGGGLHERINNESLEVSDQEHAREDSGGGLHRRINDELAGADLEDRGANDFSGAGLPGESSVADDGAS